MIVNKRQLADILGMAEETLTQYQKDSTFPVLVKRRGRSGSDYETADVIAWLERRKINATVGNQDLIDLEEGKRRKMAAEAGLAELELLKEQGKVIEIERVADELGEQLSNLRAKLLSIPSKVAGQAYTAKDIREIKQILDDAIFEALNELSGHGASGSDGQLEDGDSDGDQEAPEAATKADGI
jgi:phage terminase Nu1 subunit (DNA packaging protein)